MRVMTHKPFHVHLGLCYVLLGSRLVGPRTRITNTAECGCVLATKTDKFIEVRNNTGEELSRSINLSNIT